MDDTSRRFTPGSLDTLNVLLNSASSALNEQRRDPPSGARPLKPILGTENTGILFTGNPHEAVPRRLLLDNRLTPLERNAWQVFRLLLNDDGLTSFPTYEQLQPYLAASPFKVASRETVAKALTTLRLTRWLSLAGRVRDEVTGQMKGNIYLLHDEPISISEAMLLDRNYLELVGNSLEHANKSIRQVAANTLDEFAQDPHVREHTIPGRLEIIEQRLARQSWSSIGARCAVRSHDSELGQQQSELSEMHSELGQKSPVRNSSGLSSESELIRKQGLSPRVRNPNSSSTCTNTNTAVCKSSVPRARPTQPPDYPPPFQTLPPDQRHKAIIALGPLAAELRQDVLDQWAAKPQESMRNPFGYLLRMIEKARNGEFNTHPQHSGNRPAPAMTNRAARVEEPPAKVHSPSEASRLLASQQLAAMMTLVGKRASRGARDG
ncbi:STY4528 family pathogenicity island replication protein [Pseudomonas syringae]|uniref:STY4528 family pathogenicity island replication protein n=1 Tax=Pseudomonas syringae TaxID=317 RepID=UPI000691FE9D|nr:STY4528 family pathogenicity island replication protein [Pseudomonas syringae]